MATTNGAQSGTTYFDNQRTLLVNEVAAVRLLPIDRICFSYLLWKQSMEKVLQNINKLNRSLEGVIAVCFTPTDLNL